MSQKDIKTLVLAGGFGTRLSEETQILPKPMVNIGERPMLWHIMKHYHQFGYNRFGILLGYKGEIIKNYFVNYAHYNNHLRIDLKNGTITTLGTNTEPWEITLLDTGVDTLTGSRIKKATEYIGGETFMLTYGDGVADINISKLLREHKKSGKLITLTAVRPEGRFGALEINNKKEVCSFQEKISGDGRWINGGFFVCEPEILDYIPHNTNIAFEREPLETLAKDRQIHCYYHKGFWKCMDTLADKMALNKMWEEQRAPWKTWLNK